MAAPLISKHPLENYQYEIPESNIRKIPIEPRDHARLLIYNTKTDQVFFDRFFNLVNYLPQGSLMVMNNTGVIPARIIFTKDTGGKVEGLFLVNEGIQEDGTIPVIVNKQILVGRKLSVGNYIFKILRHEEQYFFLYPEFDVDQLPDIMMQYGMTPTPKYLGKIGIKEEEIRSRYQTIFSREKKSVAAPTASLHFTEGVFNSLEKKNIQRAETTLHVGMGTFAEVTKKNMEEKKLHTEPISLDKHELEKIRRAKMERRDIIAVGTTAIRAIESQADNILDPDFSADIHTNTNLFILPGYEFKLADILITNFHVPKSSLMALVDAFFKHKKAKRSILDLYRLALENGFQFFSFGDGMLIL